MNFFIGVDIGGTKIAAGVVTSDGKAISRAECPTPVKEGGAKILADSIALIRSVIDECEHEISGIGIGAGGQINAVEGYVFSATDVLPGWKGLRIVGPVSEAFKLPVQVDNDVNVLAAGEHRFGAARDYPKGTVVFLALGTGVGGAILINGAMHYGAHWSGGELGHILLNIDSNARCDTGGARGTLEAYCSGPGLVQTYRELSGKNAPELTGHDVVADADQDHNGPGTEAIRKTGEYLGFGLVSLANALDPNIIVIGGGLASLGERLLGPARDVLRQRALPGPATCPVVSPALGADAAIIGAASLVIP